MYLYGSPFTIVVDHTPLVPLYNDPARPLPARVDRNCSKLLGFDFKVFYEPGSSNPCDYASCHPKPIPGIKKLTEIQKDNLGVEDKEEDSDLW